MPFWPSPAWSNFDHRFCHVHSLTFPPTRIPVRMADEDEIAELDGQDPRMAEGAREFYEGDSDDEDELFCDVENDPNVLRRVYELDGMEEGGAEEDEEEDEHGAGMALRPDGYSDGRDGGDDDEDGMEDDEPTTDMSAVTLEHGEQVYAVAVSPTNPDLIATACGNDTGALWRKSEGKLLHSLGGHTDTVVDVAFSASGNYLATAGMDSLVKIWNASDGSLVVDCEGPSEDILWVKWHSKGDVVLAGSTDMSIWMWSVPAGQCMAVFSGHSGAVNAGTFTGDGKHILTAAEDCSARVWNPKDGSCLVTLHDPKGAGTFHMATITCMDTLNDLMLTGSEDNTAILSHIAFSDQAMPTARVVAVLKHHEDAVEAVAFSKVSPFFATGGLDGRAFIYDSGNQTTPRVACQHEAGVTQLAWHPKNSWLVSAGVDRSVRAWDAKTGNLLVAWTGHRDMIMGLAISPDGTYVVSASDDNTARVWQFPNQ